MSVITFQQNVHFDSFAGNSYRDGSVYVSSVQKPPFEAIAVCYSNSNRSLSSRDRYFSKVLGEAAGETGNHQLSDFGEPIAVGHSEARAEAHHINIYTQQGKEIFLNIYPAGSNDQPQTHADIKINIDIPREQSTGTVAAAVAPNYSVIYNRKGTVQISVAHDTNLKLKHLKRSSGRLSLLHFIKFKRTSKRAASERKRSLAGPDSSPYLHNVQQMLNEDLITPHTMLRNRLRRRSIAAVDNEDSRSITSLTQESELDAYMREVRMRTIDVG